MITPLCSKRSAGHTENRLYRIRTTAPRSREHRCQLLIRTGLRDHPNVFMPDPKEPHYFAPDFPRNRYVDTEDAYLRLFTPCRPEQRAIVLWPHKLIRVAGEEVRLYQLEEDPGEHVDRAAEDSAPTGALLQILERDGARVGSGVPVAKLCTVVSVPTVWSV